MAQTMNTAAQGGAHSILDPENLRFFFHQTTGDIQNIEKQKWRITYYSLILNGIIVALFKLLEMDTIVFIEQILLFSLSLLFTLSAIVYLVSTQKTLVEYRIRLRRIYKNLPDDKYMILEKMRFNQSSFSYQIFNVIIPHIGVLLFACGIVVYLIFR